MSAHLPLSQVSLTPGIDDEGSGKVQVVPKKERKLDAHPALKHSWPQKKEPFIPSLWDVRGEMTWSKRRKLNL
jgi:hypothetical protein